MFVLMLLSLAGKIYILHLQKTPKMTMTFSNNKQQLVHHNLYTQQGLENFKIKLKSYRQAQKRNC